MPLKSAMLAQQKIAKVYIWYRGTSVIRTLNRNYVYLAVVRAVL